METQRYPISARLVGVLHKEKSKVGAHKSQVGLFHARFNQQLCPLQMYMTSVLWSDHNEIVVYRTFQDFRKMHVSGANVAGCGSGSGGCSVTIFSYRNS
ncbi:unnamed protein product [Tetraodon nigroviridis]|uniref:(spotted green pufferfish) hypothetical protein n=1 Tax=Tetraodon nigroviridis TaxID=99883 RepID=Q4THC7_TETNG|nr:unnamed protein product [Tetraodon nigroviridis]